MKKWNRAIACMLAFAMIMSQLPVQMMMAEDTTGAEVSTTAETVVYYTSNGERTNVVGDTITIPYSDEGTFALEGYASEELEWKCSAYKNVSVGLYTGLLYCTKPDTITVTVSKRNSSEVYKTFTLVASDLAITDFKMYIDSTEVADKGTYTVAGRQWKEVMVKAKLEGKDTYIAVPARVLTFTPDDTLEMSTANTMGGKFIFNAPGTGNIKISPKNNAELSETIEVTSTYVPIESIQSNVGETFEAHERNYFTGMFIGITGSDLKYTVTPENASYGKNKTWSTEDKTIAEYFELHGNGVVPYKSGTTGVTITCIDKGADGSASVEHTATTNVKFSYKNPVEAVSIATANITLGEGASQSLKLTFTPEDPSEPGMNWAFDKDGVVAIEQATDDLTSFSLSANIPGEVTVTGTPKDTTNVVEPITFKVTVTESPAPIIDTVSEAKIGMATAKKFWKDSLVYGFGGEWDVLAQTRAGKALGENKISAYVSDVVKRYKDTSNLTSSDLKGTTVARVAITMAAIGQDANSVDGIDFIKMLYDNKNLNGTANDPAWALIAYDSKNYAVPEGATWGRQELIAAILDYQNTDGGFPLSKNQQSGVDITAMCIQALAKYQTKENVKAATDKALSYLRAQQSQGGGFQDSGSYNCESVSQVILALTSLGLDPVDPANGFVIGKNRNVITNIMTFKDFSAGFIHKKGDWDVAAMATQQALLALDSYIRLLEGRNSSYDMSDVESSGNVLPTIEIIGIADNARVGKSQVKVTVTTQEGCTQSLRLNNVAQQGEDGTYLLQLASGVNTIIGYVANEKGVKNFKTITVTFSPWNFSTDIKNLKVAIKSAIEKTYNFKEVNELTNLAAIYNIRDGVGMPLYYQLIAQNAQSIKFSGAEEWASTIQVITALGGDPQNVNGVNLLLALPSISDSTKQWSFKEAAQILIALNTKNYDVTCDKGVSLRAKLTQTVLEAKKGGGFSGAQAANPLDTALAIRALRLSEQNDVINNAITYLANNLTVEGSYGGTPQEQVATLTQVLLALSDGGIDIALDDRFNNEQNIFTSLKALVANAQVMNNCGPKAILEAGLALLALERVGQKVDGLFDMSAVALKHGMMSTEAQLATYAEEQILRSISFDAVSENATEAMAIMLKTGVTMGAADSYVELLKAHVEQNKITTAKEYFYTVLLLDAMGQDPTSFNKVNLIEKLCALDMKNAEEWTYALMSLNLGNYELSSESQWDKTKLKAEIIKCYYAAFGGVKDGSVRVDSGTWAALSYAASINSIFALTPYKSDPEVLVDKTAGYLKTLWSNTKLSKDLNHGELWGKIITAVAFADINATTNAGFVKGNQSIMTMVSDCLIKIGENYSFTGTKGTNTENLQSALAIYTALKSVERLNAWQTHIYMKADVGEVDKSALTAKLDEIKALDGKLYTEESYNALMSVVATAKAVLASETAGQNSINTQLLHIQNAIAALVKAGQPPVEKQEALISIDAITIGQGYFVKDKAIEIVEGDTVYDILKKTVGESNLRSTGSGNGVYISSMKLNGSWLGEIDHGPLSGWMYSVNGKFPDVSCGAFNIKSGDTIRWRYTKNLGQDIGDNSTGAILPGPTGGGGSAEVVLTPTVDKNGMATAKLTAEDSAQLVKSIAQVKDEAGSVAVISANVPQGTRGISLALPSEVLSALSKTKNVAVSVQSQVGKIVLSAKAVAAITSAANGAGIEVSMSKSEQSTAVQFADRPSYDISILSSKGKLSTFDGGKISITLPYELKTGESGAQLAVYHVAEDGTTKKMPGAKYDAASAMVIFDTEHLSTFVIAYEKNVVFSDVPQTHWASEYIYSLANLGIINGKTSTSFAPGENITRAEFVTMLAKCSGDSLAEATGFDDVIHGAWYAGAIGWAAQKGIVTGVGENKFAPENLITRQDMAVALNNYIKYKGISLKMSETADFADADTISQYAKEAAENLHRGGILTGKVGNLAQPQKNATRAEAAAVLARLLQK